jgi:RNA polymerase sigma factor (sigma-70 family)
MVPVSGRTTSDGLQQQLWLTHAAELTRYATLLVGPHDAADIVAAAFLRASVQIAGGTVTQPRAYLFRAVTNEAHDQRRRQANRWRRDLLAVAAATVGAPETQVDVRRAVAALSVRQRAVVYLAYWVDLSERSIAETLGLSLGSVRRHLIRARAHLRKALE